MTNADLAPIQNVDGTTPTKRLVRTAREVEAAVTARGYRITLMYGSTTWDDHINRRCVDVMTSSARTDQGDQLTVDQQHALGDWIADHVWDNADRLGLNWLIWWRRIRRFQNTDKGHGWGTYTGDNPHVDHVHIEIESGQYLAPPGGGPGVPTMITTTTPVAGTTYWVDPATVHTFLYGLAADGSVKHHRPPGFRLRIVKIITWRGRQWGVTAYHTRYALEFLTTVEPK